MKMSLSNRYSYKIWLLIALIITGFALSASSALAATLSISPATGVYTAGETFTASVVVNTAGKGINAADGTLSFNPSELSVVSVSKGNIFSLWTAEPTFSNSAGTISFSGGHPTGYTGSNGVILTITLRAATAGNPKVQFKNGSVLAADGRGTNVLTNMNGGTYTIAAAEVAPEPEVIEYVAPANTPGTPVITSTTHPDPSTYHQDTTAVLSWTLPAGVTAVRTSLNGNSGGVPTRVYDTPISEITLEDLEQGVQYFHLQFQNADGWGRVTHYRLAVDSEAPERFNISLPEGADLSNPEQSLNFDIEDATSEVRRFIVELDGGEAFEYIDEIGSSSMKLPALEPGRHSVIIEALDEADNGRIATFSFSVLAFDKPQFIDYPSQINEEVIPVITGITRPEAVVKVTLSRPAGDAETYEVVSDATGEFIFIPDGRWSEGVYELTAVAIDQHGAMSEPADAIRIAVQQPGYIKIGSLLVSVLSIIIPLVALVTILILGLWYFILRLFKMRSSVARESHEALDILTREFTALRDELTAQSSNLKSARKSGKLTKAESELVARMNNELAASEKRVAAEISDVEDIVD